MPSLSDYRIFLISVVAACILSTLIAISLPLDDLISSYPVLKYAIRQQHLQFRRDIMSDLENSKALTERVVLIIQYSCGTFMRFGKEICIMAMLLRYFPLVKGNHS
jgi:hypothetical protein